MWVKAVATAILAGVIAQILVEPPGALATIPAVLRYGALAVGFCRLYGEPAVDLCRRGRG